MLDIGDIPAAGRRTSGDEDRATASAEGAAVTGIIFSGSVRNAIIVMRIVGLIDNIR